MFTTPGSTYETAGTGVLIPSLRLLNQYDNDSFLQSILERLVGKNVVNLMQSELSQLGHDAANKYYDMGEIMERDKPRLIAFDAFGHRINKLVTCHEWNQMKVVSSHLGVVATGFATQHNPYTSKLANINALNTSNLRILQFTKLLLWAASSGLFSCPIAMTDGAATLLQHVLRTHTRSNNRYLSDRVGLNSNQISFLFDAFSKLTSFSAVLNSNGEFWTSGQWMTERGGGSDVSVNGTNTIAVKQANVDNSENVFNYRLFGYKWFSSASDANIAIALARIESNDGKIGEGNKGISCFLVKVKDDDSNELNNINMVRLKDKLGTRQLPTAELELVGAPAILISEPGKGVSTIMKLANITRIHNSVSACSAIRRAISFAREYAKNRKILGKDLTQFNLHKQTLFTMEVVYRASCLLSFQCVKLLGRTEMKMEDEDSSQLLRLLTPLAKLYTAKAAVAVTSEGIECMGGIGYLEDSGMPKVFRDAQVLPVWEGTTNVLSMDVLRVLRHPRDGQKTWMLYCKSVRKMCDESRQDAAPILEDLDVLSRYVRMYGSDGNVMTNFARDFALSLARVYIGALMVQHAAWSQSGEDRIVVDAFVNGRMQGTWFGRCGLVTSNIVDAVTNQQDKKPLIDEKSLDSIAMGVCVARSRL